MLGGVRGHGSHKGQFKGVLDGGRIWWVAPNYKQIAASQIWENLKKVFKGAYENGLGKKSEVDREITLANGGSIAVRSADGSDSLRGPGLDGVVMDEAAFISRDIWTDSIRPALMDRQGWAILGTTPNGPNWIKDLADKCDGGRDGWEYWHQPSWSNPLITQEELDDIYKEIGPNKYAQEIEAQYAEPEGALWPNRYFENLWASVWPDRFEVSAIAIDPSIGKESRDSDYSAIIFGGISGGKIFLDADIRRRPPGELVDDAIRMYRNYMPTGMGIEANGFQSVLKDLFDLKCQMQGIPPIPIIEIFNYAESKKTRIQRLDPYLDQHKFRFMQHVDEWKRAGLELLLEQMQMFPSKNYHDDGPDALEMLIRIFWQLIERSRSGAGDSYGVIGQ